MMHSPTSMSFSRQPQVLAPPTTAGMWAGFNPETIDPAEWPDAPSVSLTIDRIIRDALSAGLSLRETYQEVCTALVALGVQTEHVNLDRCVRNHVLAAI